MFWKKYKKKQKIERYQVELENGKKIKVSLVELDELTLKRLKIQEKM
ncbi:hypothetical protein OCB08_01375 [Bacillus cereus]|nr:hypothetical protein [Bacillus cereus]AOM07592.1 hypothetical protein FORC24_4302 [Bacillus cereus]MCC2366300.1 hypothetical protein [Bacillus cereus]MCC2451938.1 hypothetical protein [Bacillus cereus]MCC2490920.1 hypothetical protein [Bacillus cereus]MCU5624064.1 hypothetical protein [Bacillus cereus]